MHASTPGRLKEKVDAAGEAWVNRVASCTIGDEPAPAARGAAPWVQSDPAPIASWASLHTGRWRWRIAPGWERFWTGPTAVAWDALDRDPRAQQVKHNDGRQVYKILVSGFEFYVKLEYPTRRWARTRRWLRGTNAARECRVADYARRHGVRAVRAVGWGEAAIEPGRPLSILVTLGVPEALPMQEAWSALQVDQPGARQRRLALTAAAADLLASAHQNGLSHSDLHAGNVLVSPAEAGHTLAWLVDLQAIRIGRPVDTTGVIRNLVQFNQWFRANARLSDRVRFLRQYLEAHARHHHQAACPVDLTADLHDWLTRMEPVVRRHAERLYARRDRRVGRAGRYFGLLRLNSGGRAQVYLQAKRAAPDGGASLWKFSVQQWKGWLGDPQVLARPAEAAARIKDSHSSLVCRATLQQVGGASLPIICKHWRPRGTIHRLLTALGRSRAMRAWRLANALLHREIATARPLAVIERRRCGLLTDTLLITEELTCAQDLDTVLVVRLRTMPPDQQRRVKRTLIDSLAGLCRRLHQLGYVHRDLKAPNIMVRFDEQGPDRPRAMIVDLDGLRRPRWRREPRQWAALARLNISIDHCTRVTRADRLRFLLSYLRRPGRPAPAWKPIWRTLQTLSIRRRAALHRHQDRMIQKFGRF